VRCRHPPHCLWCGGGHRHGECSEKQKSECVPTCWNCDLRHGESPHPASYIGYNHAKQVLERRGNLQATTQGSAGRTFFSKYIIPNQSFAAALHSSNQLHRLQPSKQKRHSFQEKI
jgi:hypothetical protein